MTKEIEKIVEKNFCYDVIAALKEEYPNVHYAQLCCKILQQIVTKETWKRDDVRYLLYNVEYMSHYGFPSWWGLILDTAVQHIIKCIKLFPNEEELLPF